MYRCSRDEFVKVVGASLNINHTMITQFVQGNTALSHSEPLNFDGPQHVQSPAFGLIPIPPNFVDRKNK